jgi:peptidoglycan/LPS O-acetylase OafA/YrhL
LAGRAAVLLGDASFCTYLFHLWANRWAINWVHQGSSRIHLERWALLLYLICAVIAANLLGVAIHLAIERPMTRALGRIRFGRAVQQPA